LSTRLELSNWTAQLLNKVPSIQALGLTKFRFDSRYDNGVGDFRAATNLTWLELTDCWIYRRLLLPKSVKTLNLSVSGWDPELGPAPLPALEELRLHMRDRPADYLEHVIATRPPPTDDGDAGEPQDQISDLKTLVLEGHFDHRAPSPLLHPRLRRVEVLDLDVDISDSEMLDICGTFKVAAWPLATDVKQSTTRIFSKLAWAGLTIRASPSSALSIHRSNCTM
jgi:hypothetical protein